MLPKTTETVGLVERTLIRMADLPGARQNRSSPGRQGRTAKKKHSTERARRMALAETIRNRSLWWILGTSLVFEAVVLALGAWVFCRRDF